MNKRDKLHRSTECPDCKVTNWEAMKQDFVKYTKTYFEQNCFTQQEYEHSLKFFEEASYDEFNYIYQMFLAESKLYAQSFLGTIIIQKEPHAQE